MVLQMTYEEAPDTDWRLTRLFFIDASDGMILLILYTCGACGTFPTTAFATRRISQLSGRPTKSSPAGGLDLDTRN
jgi:hypothetical protein